MKTDRKTTRRSFLVRVAGGAAALGGAVALIDGAAAQNTRYSGVTDCDSGQGADRPGYGTGVRNQITDSDTGPGSDPRCRGRGSNTGANSGTQYNDQAQPDTRCSDSDYGQYGDPGGRGRACRGLPPNQYAPRVSGCTDSDTGNGADSVGNGRRCTPRGG
jgi:hypothetical protein